MDENTIEDEIYDFCDTVFKSIKSDIEDEIEFIESNNLFQPKDNFFILFDYLNATINYFRNLDNSIMQGTFRKLYTDVNSSYKHYEKYKEMFGDSKDIFHNQFLKKSEIFSMFYEELLERKNAPDQTIEEQQEYKKLIRLYKELRAYYYEKFETIFEGDKKYYLNALLATINTKMYYLDKFLWREVTKSRTIMRTLREVETNDSVMDSKSYIKYRVGVIMPTSKEHPYLQRCLKVYK